MLIEAMTLLFVFSVVVVTFYSVISLGLGYIQNSKNRLIALAVANERMEIMRNLKYEDIGTIDGEISGNIPQEMEVTEAGKTFLVRTLVEYQLDSYDELYPPDDLAFEDYKKVLITVSWSDGISQDGEVQLESRFVPAGLEVPNPNDGILLINVFSDQPGGAGIPGSTVRVVNLETGLNTEKETAVDGSVYFLGDKVGESIQKYQITVTKTDHETVATFPPYPETAYNPVDVHASVVLGQINVTNIVQNELANIKIRTVDFLDQPIEAVDFHLEGGRRLGTNLIEPYDPIYNFEEDGETNSEGEKLFSSLSPGAYVFSLADAVLEDYALVNITPHASFVLQSADETLDVRVQLAAKTVTSLLVDVLSSLDESPVEGINVRLTNTEGYDQVLTTGEEGKVFFPISSDPFLPGDYHLEISAEGINTVEQDVTINADELKISQVHVTAI